MDLLELARAAATGYAATGLVGAVVMAGSVARGFADAYSDVELDVFWLAPPSDLHDRLWAAAAAPPSAAVPLLDDLLDETLAIVHRTLPEVDVHAVRDALRNPRTATGQRLP